MANNIRLTLIVALMFVGFMLWNAWQADYGVEDRPQPDQPASSQTPAQTASGGDVPSAVADALPGAATQTDAAPLGSGAVEETPAPAATVVTDTFRIAISSIGANVHEAYLLKYPVDVEEPTVPYQLMAAGDGKVFIAQTGFISDQGAVPDHRVRYESSQPVYQLQPGQQRLSVPLVWEGNGLRVTKIYTFTRGSYVIEVSQRVENLTAEPVLLRQYRQLQRTPQTEGGGFSLTDPASTSYLGAAVYSPDAQYIQVEFEEMLEEGRFQEQITGGWAAMVQHYFFSAWIPKPDQTNYYYSQVHRPAGLPRFIIGAMTPQVALAPATAHTFTTRLFIGPKLQDRLEDIAPGLSLTVDYGIFTILAQPLFWILSWIHSFVGNWGWAIVVVTILIKLAFYKLTDTQYKSMAKLRKVQPRMQALKERYGDDKQKLNQAMMELYRKEKVNPLGGCLPLLIQIPFLIAFYWVLLESVELRQAPWILWINDLSAPDPYFILPLIMGASMFLQQKMTPMPSTDPMQEKVMMALPFIFTVMFAFFAAGLVLYWTVNNILSVAQQWVITKRMESD